MKSVDVFDYISPLDNDKFTKLSGDELQTLIVLLDDFYLELRNRLDLSNNVTFGLELEFENCNGINVHDELIDLFEERKWLLKNDGSLKNGGEITSPVLKDEELSWVELKRVCEALTKTAEIGPNSSSHVHIGAHILEKRQDYYIKFLKLWAAYENIIFRFCYGEYDSYRPNIVKYARPVAKKLASSCKKFEDGDLAFYNLLINLKSSRYQAVNFDNVSFNSSECFAHYNTIEFRCPNGTLSPAIWQNNVNLFTNLLEYSKNKDYDKELILYRQNKQAEHYEDLNWYNKIYLNEALELCDILFDKNIDKVYFLKQYLKSFEDIKNNSEYKKCKKLVK